MMTTEIIIGMLSLIGTAIGSTAGILTANKLVNYRIGRLEEKVSKHNDLIERMYKVEARVTMIEDNHKHNI